MDKTSRYINDALVQIYSGILWIEEKELKKSRFNDLTIKEMHAINAISMYNHKTASEVARELHLTPGSLTATIDRLVKKGYVERIRGNDDRRVIRLGLTKKGRLMYRAHDAFHHKMVEGFLKDTTPEELQVIEKAIKNLENFLSEHS
ncbi:MarR family winged helix-turn-helix transcriptional regulator [Ligilactobacillus apodemi]|uniref:MarR family transcriptional regulator n=1 Tax=Ligilactobacillus apodemi DSM 16634 = JCM 16172 TaxID=1423724 RepID=A0A0R1TZD6_9LACO|nr:MarR family transcriptional regulator [Ligilactobacillus apodemi]KRL84259.1 MarR family transcriptional regulator [Ligilactobacillus apodemi DSM 16634 = JCM 16172]MBD5069956.1 MarR family transcriptional regulator [Lactobacillus sp.]MCR1901304.1 MarR family transcriptional regulator [Ligilactobacillus apodemi]